MARTKKTEVEVVTTPTNTKPSTYLIDELLISTGRLHPIHPVKLEPMETWIDLVGVDTDEFDRAVVAVVMSAKNIVDADLTDEQKQQIDDRRTRELAARCIVGWDETTFGPYSQEAAIALMCNPRAKWLSVQVQKFLDDRTNFFKA